MEREVRRLDAGPILNTSARLSSSKFDPCLLIDISLKIGSFPGFSESEA